VSPERIAVVLSAQHSNEDNFALLSLARALGTSNLYVSGKAPGEGDAVLRHADKNPNTAGVVSLNGGTPPKSVQDLVASVTMAEHAAIIALGSDAGDVPDVGALSGAKIRVVVAAHEGPLARSATVLLPASSWAESDGTFVNAKGLAQESEQAIGPVGDSRPAWKLVAGLALRLGHDFGWRKLADVRSAMDPGAGSQPAVGAASAGASS
jgi:NADH-quinone oxidoreductase subunit G